MRARLCLEFQQDHSMSKQLDFGDIYTLRYLFPNIEWSIKCGKRFRLNRRILIGTEKLKKVDSELL
jgi:hypothetical protein